MKVASMGTGKVADAGATTHEILITVPICVTITLGMLFGCLVQARWLELP